MRLILAILLALSVSGCAESMLVLHQLRGCTTVADPNDACNDATNFYENQRRQQGGSAQ